jgi:hypothetical protein
MSKSASNAAIVRRSVGRPGASEAQKLGMMDNSSIVAVGVGHWSDSVDDDRKSKRLERGYGRKLAQQRGRRRRAGGEQKAIWKETAGYR